METNKSKEEIIVEFKKKRTRQIIAVFPMLLAVFGVLSVEDNPEGLFGLTPGIILAISIGLIVLVLVFSRFNWKCPSCQKYLGKAFNPKFCSNCGSPLR